MIKLATMAEMEEATDAEAKEESLTLTVLSEDDPRGSEYPVDEEEPTSEFEEREEVEEGEEERGEEQAAPVDVKDEPVAEVPVPAPPEKILQLPDEVLARDLALIEAHQNDISEQRAEISRRQSILSIAKQEMKECKA